MIETEKKEERVLLIGVELQGMDNMIPRPSSALVSWKRLRLWWMQKKSLLSSSTIV
ncbi:Uncharacterised protein [Mycobacterium tuberculosis]|nr:Uncharacterised protein [Mycobacterium tuberculosis]